MGGLQNTHMPTMHLCCRGFWDCGTAGSLGGRRHTSEQSKRCYQEDGGHHGELITHQGDDVTCTYPTVGTKTMSHLDGKLAIIIGGGNNPNRPLLVMTTGPTSLSGGPMT